MGAGIIYTNSCQPAMFDGKNIVSDRCGSQKTVNFTNYTPFVLNVYWVGYDGYEKFYFVIKPFCSITQTTYIDHVWVCRNMKKDQIFICKIDGKSVNINIISEPVPQKYIYVDECFGYDARNFLDSIQKKNTGYAGLINLELDYILRQNKALFVDSEMFIPDGKRCLDFRCSRLFPAGGPTIFDIIQGDIGDCWLLEAICATVSVCPSKIEEMFYPRELNPLGFYIVKFNFQDECNIYVLIDDYLPVVDDTLVYSKYMNHNGDKCFWVPLLEKAFAKYSGKGYSGLEARNTVENPASAITLMCGGWNTRSLTFVNTIPVEKMWDFLLDLYVKGRVICFSTTNSSAVQTHMVRNHGYALVDMMEFKAKHKLLRIKNTWGKTEFNGKNSDKWIKEIPEIADTTDDGVFWMEVHDFYDEFYEIWNN